MKFTGILNDREIKALCIESKMIQPFTPRQEGKPSYGLGSFGYDIRLGSKFLVPIGGINAVLDPIDFPHSHFREIEVTDTLEIAPGSQVLAESVERFRMLDDIAGVCWGKSSYARCGLLVNVTPLEPGWIGVLTIELVNLSPLPIRLHVGQGIAQVVFFRGERPARTYAEKEAGGIYQNQPGVTLPR
ncbi:dCTP deaminase [Candidatus Acetothermia bacterium]|nr:MAG: dCTP deaminase [Candidatus Acetothermia bacterium]HHK67109.1 dCTP deaminase [Candidatus Acetothermia bacterium]